jgi:hypothetical protein
VEAVDTSAGALLPEQEPGRRRWIGFHPGLFARAYLTYDIPIVRSYVYGDAQFTAERYAKPRLMEIDSGFATRPFSRFENLECRAGNDVIMDVQANTTRDLVYGAVRIAY